MARLLTTGFETLRFTNSVTTNGEGQATSFGGGGTPTGDTSNQWSGSCCLKCAKGVQTYVSWFESVPTETWQWAQVVFKPGSTWTGEYLSPLACSINGSEIGFYCFADGSEVGVYLQGAEEDFWEPDPSFKLPSIATEHHIVELGIWPHASILTKSKLHLAIRDEQGNLIFDHEAERNIGGTGTLGAWAFGNLGSTACDLYVSQAIINSSTGAAENSQVGYQKVALLKSVSDSAREGFVTGAGGTTNLFNAVDNFPPVGVANGSKTATSQIYSATNSTTHFYRANTATYEASIASGGGGLAAGDTITAMMAIARISNSSSTGRNMAVKCNANPEIAEATTATSGTAGTDPTGWRTITTAYVYAPTPTRSSGAQPNIRKAAGTTDATACDMLGVYLSYKPAAAENREVSAPTATAAATGIAPSVSAPSAPSVTTGEVTGITSTEGTINGEVNMHGLGKGFGGGIVLYEWSPVGGGETHTFEEEDGESTSTILVSHKITGLTSGKSYIYRVKAENSAGLTFGEPKLFTTSVDQTVNAPTAAAAATGVTAVVSATQDATIAAPTALAAASGPAPSVASYLELQAVTASASATAIVPSVSAEISATLVAPTAASAGSALIPAVLVTQNQTVSAVVALGTASALEPSVLSQSFVVPPAPARTSVTDALYVEDAAGNVLLRFGGDEEEASHSLVSATFNTAADEGFGPGDFEVGADEKTLGILRRNGRGVRLIVAETGETLYAGRITGTPQQNPDTITIETESWSNALKDDETARAIFIDRDLSNWGPVSTAQKIFYVNAGYAVYDPSVTPDPATGQPALEMKVEGNWGSRVPIVEAQYDAKGLTIRYIDYAWKPIAWGYAPPWTAAVGYLESATTVVASQSGNLVGVTQLGTLATTGNARFATTYWHYTIGSSGEAGQQYPIQWTMLTIIGDHGLPLQGSIGYPNTGRSILLSDIAAYIVGKWAPQLRFTTGAGGTIEPQSLGVSHASFREETTADAMLESLQAFGGNGEAALLTGTYGDDGKEFYMAAEGQFGRTWIARQEGDEANAEPISSGPDISNFINGAKVTYSVNGVDTKSVGPLGSGSDVESVAFEDRDPANPANEDGSRHWALRDIGSNSREMAEAVAVRELAYRNNRDWRGTIKLTGEIEDIAGNRFPAGMVRGGDRVIIADAEDDRPRPVESTSSDDPLEARVNVGAPPDRIAALLARAEQAQSGRLP